MTFSEWIEANKPSFGSHYEVLFAESVLPLTSAIGFDDITIQYPFRDIDRKQRYCDFVISENEDVRIAIEIDGYDKRGTGSGMTHSDFIDWQRRHAALTSQGWYVLRFANRDVRDQPERCAEHINLILAWASRQVSSGPHRGRVGRHRQRQSRPSAVPAAVAQAPAPWPPTSPPTRTVKMGSARTETTPAKPTRTQRARTHIIVSASLLLDIADFRTKWEKFLCSPQDGLESQIQKP